MRGCVNRPAALREDSWKAGYGALWDLKYHWWQLLSEEHLGALAPVQQHLLGCSFLWEWALGFARKGIEDPCSSSLGWAILYSHPIWFTKKHEADFSVNRTKLVYMHLVRATFVFVLWFPSCGPSF